MVSIVISLMCVLLQRSSSAGVSLEEQEEVQYLQVCSVKPLTRDNVSYNTPNVPDKIKYFYAVNKVNRFTYDRPFHKGEQDQDNEFVSLWIERTTYTSSEEFPGILKWFEVVNKEVNLVSPLQFACESMRTKNEELQTLIREHSTDR